MKTQQTTHSGVFLELAKTQTNGLNGQPETQDSIHNVAFQGISNVRSSKNS